MKIDYCTRIVCLQWKYTSERDLENLLKLQMETNIRRTAFGSIMIVLIEA